MDSKSGVKREYMKYEDEDEAIGMDMEDEEEEEMKDSLFQVSHDVIKLNSCSNAYFLGRSDRDLELSVQRRVKYILRDELYNLGIFINNLSYSFFYIACFPVISGPVWTVSSNSQLLFY